MHQYNTIKNIHLRCFATILLSFIVSTFIHSTNITIEISFGDLVDKITILEIKSERITDEKKLNNILNELSILQKAFDQFIGDRNDIDHFKKKLKELNSYIWDIENAIRIKERRKEFDSKFIVLARSVYYTNDKRNAIKKEINIIMNSEIFEEKSYEDY